MIQFRTELDLIRFRTELGLIRFKPIFFFLNRTQSQDTSLLCTLKCKRHYFFFSVEKRWCVTTHLVQTDGAPGVGYFLIGSRGTGDLVIGSARHIINQNRRIMDSWSRQTYWTQLRSSVAVASLAYCIAINELQHMYFVDPYLLLFLLEKVAFCYSFPDFVWKHRIPFRILFESNVACIACTQKATLKVKINIIYPILFKLTSLSIFLFYIDVIEGKEEQCLSNHGSSNHLIFLFSFYLIW